MHWCYCSLVLSHRYKVIYIGLRPVSSRKVCNTEEHDIVLHISCVQYHPVWLISLLSQKCKLLLDNYVIKSTVWYEYHIYIPQVIWLTLSLSDSSQYGPVTMIVPASGHQVRCVPWVQMGTFNKEIIFLCGLKFFALNIFCGEHLQSSLHLMLQIWWKPLLWKMCQWIMMSFQTYRPVKSMFGKMVSAPLFGSSPNIR